MEQKPLITPPVELDQREDDRYENDGRGKKSRDKSVTLQTKLRATKRSLRNFAVADQYTPQRLNKSKPLINTRAMRYNPAGPGDYNLPSVFGELPDVKEPKESKSAFY